ncbi:organellar protein -related [Anaeramoeba flamelloides]|uniref:Organellar protein -related n=1 Tax=Anaeramoeba flamelloides TaxID=1746091 RepID=A0AAV7ZVP9_9EUKA|nr:organellar protein -related [Anaeramoeba flamelloides]
MISNNNNNNNNNDDDDNKNSNNKSNNGNDKNNNNNNNMVIQETIMDLCLNNIDNNEVINSSIFFLQFFDISIEKILINIKSIYLINKHYQLVKNKKYNTQKWIKLINEKNYEKCYRLLLNSISYLNNNWKLLSTFTKLYHTDINNKQINKKFKTQSNWVEFLLRNEYLKLNFTELKMNFNIFENQNFYSHLSICFNNSYDSGNNRKNKKLGYPLINILSDQKFKKMNNKGNYLINNYNKKLNLFLILIANNFNDLNNYNCFLIWLQLKFDCIDSNIIDNINNNKKRLIYILLIVLNKKRGITNRLIKLQRGLKLFSNKSKLYYLIKFLTTFELNNFKKAKHVFNKYLLKSNELINKFTINLNETSQLFNKYLKIIEYHKLFQFFKIIKKSYFLKNEFFFVSNLIKKILKKKPKLKFPINKEPEVQINFLFLNELFVEAYLIADKYKISKSKISYLHLENNFNLIYQSNYWKRSNWRQIYWQSIKEIIKKQKLKSKFIIIYLQFKLICIGNDLNIIEYLDIIKLCLQYLNNANLLNKSFYLNNEKDNNNNNNNRNNNNQRKKRNDFYYELKHLLNEQLIIIKNFKKN